MEQQWQNCWNNVMKIKNQTKKESKAKKQKQKKKQLSIKKLSGDMNFLNQSQPAKVNHRDPELLLPVNW